MRDTPIRGLLLDVGGTLWPERWPTQQQDDTAREERVSYVIGAVDPPSSHLSASIVRGLEGSASELESALVQDTDTHIRQTLVARGIHADSKLVTAVRNAMCLPAKGRIGLFEGARELLEFAREKALRCAVVTNAVWRSGEDYGRDFGELGLTDCIDAIISSVDVRLRKPHLGIFLNGLDAIDCAPSTCVLIGNSERNDVMPGLSLGINVMRVAIEEPKPARTAAQGLAGSLVEARSILDGWLSDSTTSTTKD